MAVHRISHSRIGLAAMLAASAALVFVTGSASADAGDGAFAITRSTIDSGGGVSVGGTFLLTGTVGQPDAHTERAGGTFAATGGFWPLNAGDGLPCPEDIDGSGPVDFGDILRILGAWGNVGGPEDLDGSGMVDFGDLLRVLGAWGDCP